MKTCKINLIWPPEVIDTMREFFDAANQDQAVRAELDNWLSGHNGAALIASRLHHSSTLGTFDATLELSEDFRKFLDTIEEVNA